MHPATGACAERSDRHWIALEKDRSYLAASALWFVELDDDQAEER